MVIATAEILCLHLTLPSSSSSFAVRAATIATTERSTVAIVIVIASFTAIALISFAVPWSTAVHTLGKLIHWCL